MEVGTRKSQTNSQIGRLRTPGSNGRETPTMKVILSDRRGCPIREGAPISGRPLSYRVMGR